MYQRILVPIDGSPTANRGLEEAIRLARLTGARLRLLHVIDILSMMLNIDSYVAFSQEAFDNLRGIGQKILDEGQARAEDAGVQVDTVLRDRIGNVVHEIVISEAASWKADLVVLGTHGRRGVGRMLLGSSAENIVRLAPMPVLLVREAQAEGGQAGNLGASL